MKSNLKYGWVGLYRSITSHWIYPTNRPFTKYEAWIDLLLMVNHKDMKVFMSEDLVWCKRGQTVTSQKKLMSRWSWSKAKVLRFLNVLKNDHMIDHKSDSKKTTITVLNYVDYQDFDAIEKIKKDYEKTIERLKKDLEETAKRPQKDTNNNDKKEKNENKYKYIDEILAEFVEAYTDEFGQPYDILTIGKERAAIGKLLKLYKGKYPDATSDETKAGLRAYFDSVVKVPDGWLRDNISPSLIMSKFNEINNILKNGKNIGNSKGATERELAGLFVKHFGSE